MTEPTPKKLYDVVAVNIKAWTIRIVTDRRTEKAANDIVSYMMAATLRPDEEFYAVVDAGSHQEGKAFKGEERA